MCDPLFGRSGAPVWVAPYMRAVSAHRFMTDSEAVGNSNEIRLPGQQFITLQIEGTACRD
jgi:hypothetical protein